MKVIQKDIRKYYSIQTFEIRYRYPNSGKIRFSMPYKKILNYMKHRIRKTYENLSTLNQVA